MTASIEAPTTAKIAEAVARLRAGELVAFPTETVYGLGADATNQDAVRRIFATKERPADHPVIVHLHDASQMPDWTRTAPEAATKLATAFWPGPLTLILPRSPRVADVVTGGQDTVGIRVPSHPIARRLLASFGGGIAAPSANRFGRISATTAQHVADDLGSSVSMILDGGACPIGIESTIVAFVGEDAVLLRPGAVNVAELTRVLGSAPRGLDGDLPRASGTLPSHYAPRTRASLVAASLLSAEIVQFNERDEEIAVLARTVAEPEEFGGTWLTAPEDAIGYAQCLYANLRRLDSANADEILIEAVPDDEAWLAVRDRLTRATRGEFDDRD